MSPEPMRRPLDALELSRVGATAELDGCRVVADWVAAPLAAQADAQVANQFTDQIADPTRGPGLHLCVSCDGEPLSFWVPEAAWCEWLAPQLASTALAQIAPEWLPLLAAWTLSPLDGWLQQLGRGALSLPAASVGEAPAGGWRLTLIAGSRRLPLWVRQASPGTLRTLLAALTPSHEQTHELGLGLGWCLLEHDAWRRVGVGDALPIVGMADTLDTLWLHPSASPGQLRLQDTQRAEITHAPLPPADAQPGILRLCVEAGRARLSAHALAGWVPGAALKLDARAHTVLRLCTHERLWAQGQLLRLEDGWAVRITARADSAG